MSELDEIRDRVRLANEVGPINVRDNKLYLFDSLLRIATAQAQRIEELEDYMQRIRPLARSVVLLTGADRDSLDAAMAIVRITDAALKEVSGE